MVEDGFKCLISYLYVLEALERSLPHKYEDTNPRAEEHNSGADPGGVEAPGTLPPVLKLEKKIIFLRKIVIFHTKYPARRDYFKCAPLT